MRRAKAKATAEAEAEAVKGKDVDIDRVTATIGNTTTSTVVEATPYRIPKIIVFIDSYKSIIKAAD